MHIEQEPNFLSSTPTPQWQIQVFKRGGGGGGGHPDPVILGGLVSKK